MTPELVRALTPGFIALCSICFGLGVAGRVSDASFSQALLAVSTGLGAAGGSAMNSSSGNISAKEIENVDMGEHGNHGDR